LAENKNARPSDRLGYRAARYTVLELGHMESLLCGDPDASQNFCTKNEAVIDAVTKTHDLCFEMLKLATPKLAGQEKTIVWLLGASCLREFEEIMLLAGNGYGTGATKLMRSFYERTVTMSYLAANPDQIRRFVDFSAIHWHQLLVEADEMHEDFKIPEDERKRVEADYEVAKSTFRDEKCPTCGRRPPMSWTKADMKTMASKVDAQIRQFCYNAYLMPTFHLHTTHWGIVNQSDIGESGKLRFSSVKVQETAAQTAFEQAFILLMQMMSALSGSFDLNMGKQLEEHGQNWVKAFG
jgi:Family of unknown function (DUF5677)